MTGTARLQKLGIPLVIVLVLGHIGYLLYTVRGSADITDFTRDYLGGRAYLTGRSMYTPFGPAEVSAEALGTAKGLDFTDREPATINLAHPPTLILFYLPVALLSYDWAYVVWGLLSLVLYIGLLLAAFHDSNVDALRGPQKWLWVGLFLLWVPFREQIYQGQSSLLVAVCIYGAWVLLRHNKPAASGALVGLAALLKLFPLLLLGYFLVRRRFVAFGSTLVVFGGGVALALAVFGPAEAEDYVTTVAPPESRACSVNQYNLSVWPTVYRLFVDSGRFVDQPHFAPLVDLGSGAFVLAALLALGIVATFLYVCWRAPHEEGGDDRAFASGVVASLLLSPLTWQHYMLIAAVPLVVLWRLHPDRATRLQVLLLVFLFHIPQTSVARSLIERYLPDLVPPTVGWIITYPTAGLVFLLVRLALPPVIKKAPLVKTAGGVD